MILLGFTLFDDEFIGVIFWITLGYGKIYGARILARSAVPEQGDKLRLSVIPRSVRCAATFRFLNIELNTPESAEHVLEDRSGGGCRG